MGDGVEREESVGLLAEPGQGWHASKIITQVLIPRLGCTKLFQTYDFTKHSVIRY